MGAHPRGGEKSPQKLKFADKIVGKGLSTDTILKKLKALHTELADLDQELVDVKSLETARKELIHTSVLLHKDRGVKAYAACCIADLLRLYAPDAPYTQAELRDIFQFFFKQLSAGLKGPDSSYYNEYFHLLESLSTVKSVVLVCDLDNADSLMVEIFRTLFALVRRDLAKKIEMFIVDILVALLDECHTVPPEVLETLLSQFADTNARMDQPAYRLVVSVCNATADKLQRHISQYFSDVIVQHSEEEELENVQKAHELIKNLNRSCSALLHSVIPQLEAELHAANTQVRLIATQTLGEMYAEKGGPDLIRKFPSTWNLWLGRRNDKAAAIRLKFVECTKNLLLSLPEHRDVIEESIKEKLCEPDDKVRAAACKLYSQLDYETALHHVSEAQLRAVADRGLDKKQNVRSEALNSIGKLYSLAYPEIENNDEAAVKHFSWIPNEIFRMISIRPHIRFSAEHVLHEHIFPLPPGGAKGFETDEVAWTDRLLHAMKYLDEGGIKAFLSLAGLKEKRPTVFDHLIDACVKNNGGIIDENEEAITRKLEAVIRYIAASSHDPHRVTEDLRAFAKLNESRLFKLFKTCCDTQTDLKGLVKASNDFAKRLEQVSSPLLPTMISILGRASLRYVNQSSIPTLVKRVQKGDGNATSEMHLTANNAQILLKYISKHLPALYKPHVGEFIKAIADERNPRLVEVCLQALADVIRIDESAVVPDQRTTDRIIRYALESRPRHAKFAARLLAHVENREELCLQVIESIAEALPDADPLLLVAHIAVLVQFARFAPDAFEHKSDIIMGFLLKEVLMVMSPQDPDAMDTDEEWFDDDAVTPELKAKLLSLKVCRYRCLAHTASDTAVDVAKPVLKLISALLDNNGSLRPGVEEDPKVKSRMRLQATTSLLHLSTIPLFAQTLQSRFVDLAVTIQDTCYHVRVMFLSKLLLLVASGRLPHQFNVIPFLTVHDPETDVKHLASSYVTTAFSRRDAAHHPDFSPSPEDLPEIAKYVEFYLDLVATSETVSLLYHLASKCKTVRDAYPVDLSENLYMMSEMAQELIKARAHNHSWSLTSHPGDIALPKELFKDFSKAGEGTTVSKTVYLPNETLAWLAEKTKAKSLKEKREPKPSVKRKAPEKSNRTKRSKQQRTKKWHSEDDDDDNEDALETDLSDAHVNGEHHSDPPSDEDDGESDPGEERLGRGARVKAKAKIQKQARKKAKLDSD